MRRESGLGSAVAGRARIRSVVMAELLGIAGNGSCAARTSWPNNASAGDAEPGINRSGCGICVGSAPLTREALGPEAGSRGDRRVDFDLGRFQHGRAGHGSL